jgi:hypothetical protein
MVQIYGLSDPVTGALRYVGKANNAQARLKSHLRDCRRRKTPVYSWMRKLLNSGGVPALVILAECSQEDWPFVEQSMIAAKRLEGAKLLNLAKGGDEPFCSTATRQANGRAVAKLRVSDERKARVYHLKRQVGLLLRAGLVSDSNKAKLRLAANKAPALFGIWAAV